MTTTMTQRCLVVANPVAGAVTTDLIGEVAERCGKAYEVVGTELTRRAGGARELVADAFTRPDPPRLVVAVGGDGTAREAAEGMARALGRWPHGAGPGPASDAPALLILPAGTGNSSARAIWGDRTWEDVVTRALTGPARVRHLDLMRLVEADRAVMLGASAGFIAAVTEAALAHTDIPGRDRYLQAMAATFASYRPYAGGVLVDGEPLHEGATTLVTVGGARHRVGTFEVLPRSVLDDGELDVCAVRGWSSDEERAELATHIMAGTHLGHPGVYYGRGRRIELTRTDGEPLCFEHDGEMWTGAAGSLTLEVVPGAVPVLAPVEAVAG
ncbi:diacylglycerol kinase family protein [Actinoplanes sp. NPDC049118]|uniref:diacylglycerol/lipid kinase family protein n=1 Tax=Actinoplanes sp. NPDC049118 TaxID=3155769 RepID=UPI0033EBB8BE